MAEQHDITREIEMDLTVPVFLKAMITPRTQSRCMRQL